jgi:hypothetical protein
LRAHKKAVFQASLIAVRYLSVRCRSVSQHAGPKLATYSIGSPINTANVHRSRRFTIRTVSRRPIFEQCPQNATVASRKNASESYGMWSQNL